MSEAHELKGNCILFITSNSTEKDALIDQLKSRGVSTVKQPKISPRVKAAGLDGYPLYMLNAERGGFKPESVGVLLPGILLELEPKLVLLVGFSYGRFRRVELHDVVISNELISLTDFEGKDTGLALRTFPRIESPLLGEAFNALLKETDVAFKADLKRIGSKSKLVHGAIVSGEIFASSQQFSERLFEDVPDAVGGDMEGHAVATQCKVRGIPWLIVKSPSDFGTGTDGTRNAQTHSAAMSAIAALNLAQAYVRQNKLRCPEPSPIFMTSSVSIPYEAIQIRGSSEYPVLIRRFIRSFALGSEYDIEFHDHLVGVLKEQAENAAKHADAEEVYLRGDRNGVVLEYDGDAFNPLEQYARMKGFGGGKHELTTFIAGYAGPDGTVKVDWTYQRAKNCLRIEFNKVGVDLCDNFNCSLALGTNEMRDYYLFGNRGLAEFAMCDTLWVHVDGYVVSGSDGMLLHSLVSKVPKTVNRIIVRGWPKRLIAEHAKMFRYDDRLEFEQSVEKD